MEENEKEILMSETIGNEIEVVSLEKWYNDNKAKIINKEDNVLSYVQGKLKKIRSETIQKQINLDDPYLNQNLINIVMFDSDLEKFLEKESKIDELKADFNKEKEIKLKNYNEKNENEGNIGFEPMKSMETVKSDLKKQIFNQILLDKMTKKMDSDNYLSLNSMDKKNIITKINKKINSVDLTNNFKCLHNDKNSSNLIEYDYLLKKLGQFQNKPKKNFDFGTYENKLKQINNDFCLTEEILLEKYNEMNTEINKKKYIMNTIRKNISIATEKIRRLENEKEIIMKKLDVIEEKFLYKEELISNTLNNSSKLKIGRKGERHTTMSNAEFLKIERFREEKRENEKRLQKVLNKIKDDLKKDKMKMENLIIELKDLNFKKLNVRLHLRDIYNKILKDQEEFLQEKGLIWIIKAFWNIGENAPMNLFPKIIDEDYYNFLIKYAKLDVKMNETRVLVKEKNKELTKHIIMKNQVTRQSIMNNFINMKDKIELFKKSITSTHKEFNYNYESEEKRNFLFRKKKNEENNQKESIDQVEDVKTNYLDEIKKKIIEYKTEIENIKLQEFNRIKKNYKEKQIEYKDFEEILRLFKFLFGGQEGKTNYELFLKKLNKKSISNLKKHEDNNRGKKENITEKTLENFKILKENILNHKIEIDVHNPYHFFRKAYKAKLLNKEEMPRISLIDRMETNTNIGSDSERSKSCLKHKTLSVFQFKK